MKNIALLYFMNKHKNFFAAVDEKIKNDLNNLGTTKQIEDVLTNYNVKQFHHDKKENKIKIDFFNFNLAVFINYILNEDMNIIYDKINIDSQDFILNHDYIFLSKAIPSKKQQKNIAVTISFSKNDIIFRKEGKTLFSLEMLKEAKEVDFFSKMNEDVFSYLCGEKVSIDNMEGHAEILNLILDSVSFNKVLSEKHFFGIYKIIDESFNKVKSTKNKTKKIIII